MHLAERLLEHVAHHSLALFSATPQRRYRNITALKCSTDKQAQARLKGA